LSNSSHFAPKPNSQLVKPVVFPPGRARLSTKPMPTGSPTFLVTDKPVIAVALVLTPPAEASETDYGLLTASEVAQLKLNADWVVLSACNTAAARAQGAEAKAGKKPTVGNGLMSRRSNGFVDFITEFGFVLPKASGKQLKDVSITDYNA
jgi:hypothetical protein